MNDISNLQLESLWPNIARTKNTYDQLQNLTEIKEVQQETTNSALTLLGSWGMSRMQFREEIKKVRKLDNFIDFILYANLISYLHISVTFYTRLY